jgi:hypothetical protein
MFLLGRHREGVILFGKNGLLLRRCRNVVLRGVGRRDV